MRSSLELKSDKDNYAIEKCWCGDECCRDYWLVGIGSFCQGSGFTYDEAKQIIEALRR